MASWCKLRDGSWGVKVDGTATVGQSIKVAKNSGETQDVTIQRIVFSGNGVSLCAVSLPNGTGAQSSGPRKKCWECGRSFTPSDARRNGGEWSDGYCGC